MAKGFCTTVKATEGTITMNPTNFSGFDVNYNWIAKLGNIVCGCIRMTSTTNTGQMSGGDAVIGNVPWKPKQLLSVLMCLYGGGNVSAQYGSTSLSIDTNGEIKSGAVPAFSGARYFLTTQFIYVTDD